MQYHGRSLTVNLTYNIAGESHVKASHEPMKARMSRAAVKGVLEEGRNIRQQPAARAGARFTHILLSNKGRISHWQ